MFTVSNSHEYRTATEFSDVTSDSNASESETDDVLRDAVSETNAFQRGKRKKMSSSIQSIIQDESTIIEKRYCYEKCEGFTSSISENGKVNL